MRTRIPLFAVLLPLLLTAPAATGQEGPKAVAVLRFDNDTGNPRYDNLGRGLASMMISDLSAVKEIKLIERERLDALQKELELQRSHQVDPATAQQAGLFVGAEFIVTGAFMSVDPDMRLDTRIVEVESAEIVKTAEAMGKQDRLLELQQQLAEDFIDGLGLVLTAEDRDALRARQEANSISSLEAVLAYSDALCLADNGFYVEAFEKIREARDLAPGSSLVSASFSLLRDKVEDEAKNRAVEEAGRRLGGLLGRDRTPRRVQRATGC